MKSHSKSQMGVFLYKSAILLLLFSYVCNVTAVVQEKDFLLLEAQLDTSEFAAHIKKSAEYTSVPLVRDGIPPGVFCKENLWCDQGGTCSRVCQRGSVVQDARDRKVLNYQWTLTRMQPFCLSQMLGTHNSGITLADGYGNHDPAYTQYLQYLKPWLKEERLVMMTNNQWLSITDQMNLGARMVELDTHWILDDLHIAHCGGLHVSALNTLVQALNKVASLLGHPLRWDTETVGCSPSLSSIDAKDQRTLLSALLEVSVWLMDPEHTHEFLVLFFDNQPNLAKWGKVGLLMQQVSSAFPPEMIMKPKDLQTLFNGTWPSIDTMVAAGKRLLLLSGTDYGEEMQELMFPKNGVICHFAEFDGVHDMLLPYPDCHSQRPGKAGILLGHGNFTRLPSCTITYGPLNCAIELDENRFVLDEAEMPDVTSCGLSFPSPDLLTPARAASMIWSWADGIPEVPKESSWNLVRWLRQHIPRFRAQASCVVMHSSDRRWHAEQCGAEVPWACRANTGATQYGQQWALAPSGPDSCPAGFSPDAPHTARENVELSALLTAQNVERARLSLEGPQMMPRGLAARIPGSACA